ncbi:fatty acid hydroxylase superfamily-domain-containing protein [Cercophora newfieldiana]|uniref:Fatty acid hydroxylase superfamily-domain-containing protein n=1 Tax=Cercophora newfieldiana TaxID=92897 RepID=A0AA39Y5H7_9PEZI|nr:fatty acid hydroxylase superfamily-domain-containing protein [Cercophora newfieldiana]
MANMTSVSGLPPLPTYELRPMPDLLPSFISDFWLSIIAPHIAYWAVSMFFHFIDIFDLFPQYRLHTPDEIAQRNLVSRWHCFRDVILEQIIQIGTSCVLNLTESQQMIGREDYDVAVWATRIRLAQRALPAILGALGLNAASISKNMAASHPLLAGALAGGHYPFLTIQLDGVSGGQVPAFAMWELMVAKAIYWVVIPAFQVWVALAFMDTWQYFWHRAMHVNKWMYTHWHARHHRLYVPYAYGALYNHPVEGFILDTLGAALAYKASFMTPRMGMYYFVFSMMKTVDDHCGYALPWDPLQHITSNNAAYHDIHHQSWGIKTNFSQPFFTIWDRWLNTRWEGDAKLKYERTRATAAAKKVSAAINGKANGTPNGKANGTPNGKANGTPTGKAKLRQSSSRQSSRTQR